MPRFGEARRVRAIFCIFVNRVNCGIRLHAQRPAANKKVDELESKQKVVQGDADCQRHNAETIKSQLEKRLRERERGRAAEELGYGEGRVCGAAEEVRGLGRYTEEERGGGQGVCQETGR
jgi:hypothetical protein